MSAEATRPETLRIALVGVPNCGKTALFNLLTGSRQKVANYAGVTVERKEGTLRTPSGSEHFLLHRSEEEDRDRSSVYANSTTDGAIMYGKPNVAPPLWLAGIVEEEMTYFHGLMQGHEPLAEFAALTDGSAAAAAIATADALSISLRESRKVLVTEVTG